MNRPALVALLLVAACSKPADNAAPPAATTDAPSNIPAPADTLVLTLPDSTELWLTAGRVAHEQGGAACRERGLELRKGGTTKVVPLLYTQQSPRLKNDSIFATMSKDCAYGGLYLVDPRTAQPTVQVRTLRPRR